jgi:hypothetical protein
VQHSKIVGLRSRIWSNPVFVLHGLVSAPRPAGARVGAHSESLVRLNDAAVGLTGRDFRTGARWRGAAVFLRPAPSKVRRRREHVSVPTLPPINPVGRTHAHARCVRADNASGTGASILKIC